MDNKRYEITFKYSDIYTRGNWSTQSCVLYADSEDEAVYKCKELYGLGVDCEYQIISVIERN